MKGFERKQKDKEKERIQKRGNDEGQLTKGTMIRQWKVNEFMYKDKVREGKGREKEKEKERKRE